MGENPTDQPDTQAGQNEGEPLSSEEAAALDNEAEALLTPEKPRFRDVWQMPTLVVSLLFLSAGLFMLMKSRPPSEYPQLLQQAEVSAESGKYDEGLATLARVEPHLVEMQALEQAKYHRVRGDLFYLKQMTDGGDLRANLLEVVKQYRASEGMGLPLEPEQLYRMTDAMISLSQVKPAMDYFTKIPLTDSAKRNRILKRLVERQLSAKTTDFKRAFDLIGQLLDDPNLSDEDRVWCEAQIAELRMAQGFTDEAINGLLVALQKLKADGINDLGQLYVLLGKAYYEIGEYDTALSQLERAEQILPAADDRRGEALLYLGRIAQAEGKNDDALSRFDFVVTDYPGTSSYLPALLGRAEVYAAEDQRGPAFEDFTQLVKQLIDRRKRFPDSYSAVPKETTDALMTLHDRAKAKDDPDTALRYLQLAERLFVDRPDDIPDGLLLRLAQTHQWMGDTVIQRAIDAVMALRKKNQSAVVKPLGDEPDNIGGSSIGGGNIGEGNGDTDLAANSADMVEPTDIRLDPVTKLEAKRHYLSSANYYRALAMRMQIDHPEETITNLGLAAKSYDEGGNLDKAIEVMKEYLRLTANDPRQVEGMYRLGKYYEAIGDWTGAIEQLKKLIQDHPNTLEAQRSYVLLARAHLSDTENPNAEEAERLLLHVVNGDAGLKPSAPEYADALIELGTLYTSPKTYGLPLDAKSYYPKAIRRLTEVVERYPRDRRINDVYYRLGHAYRLSAEALGDDLKQEMPDSERQRLNVLRKDHMHQALDAYGNAISGFEKIPSHKRTPVEEQNLKYARLWRADSAFAIADYQQALKYYNDVAERYGHDVTGLVALVQIVNIYAETGDFRAAKAAQFRARRQLKAMPDEAFSAGLLNRSAWEEWLSWERTLDEGVASADGSG